MCFLNVAGMKNEDRDVITETLRRIYPETECVMINSSLVSAQQRKRYYWTNWYVEQPQDKGILLKDIILSADTIADKYWIDRDFIYNGDDAPVQATLLGPGFQHRAACCYNIKAKSGVLLCDGGGGNRQVKIYQCGKIRKLTPKEYERLQTLPDNYTDCVADSHRYTAIGNGWTVDVIAHILCQIETQKTKELTLF